MTTRTTAFLAFIALGAWLALPALAAEDPNPYTKPNNSWISISGEVKSVSADSFMLDYGKGLVTVEMDDGDRDADGYKLVAGDKVTVSGRIDDDLFERTKIEASSVYVEKLGTYFYASSVDEEDAFVTVTTPIVVPTTVVQGTVTSVEGDEFTIDTGLREIKVDVDTLGYNPLDDEGYQRIEAGDLVSVTGTIDDDFFEGREVMARSIVEIDD